MSSGAALAIAILLEVIGTTCLKMSEQFTRPLPTAVMAVCYVASFWLLAVATRTIPLGLAYAIWAGAGIALISLAGVVLFGQRLDWPALVGIAMIAGGVMVINLLSDAAH
ncbi:MAG TPA: multidrug efflux SMR transporter [Paracoccus sp. (in: a-proteobacteria)]|nr:multidrug efflux SMR transporter [Paracoccus sp. (in: a-proteobacteria)]